MRDGLSYLVKGYENDGQGVARDVEYLEGAMSGMGTKDERLYVYLATSVLHTSPPRRHAIPLSFTHYLTQKVRTGLIPD